MVSDCLALLRLWLDVQWFVEGRTVPGYKLVDTRLAPFVDKTRQQIGEIRLRIDAIQLAGLDERLPRCEVARSGSAIAMPPHWPNANSTVSTPTIVSRGCRALSDAGRPSFTRPVWDGPPRSGTDRRSCCDLTCLRFISHF
jgi:hypothetical protein